MRGKLVIAAILAVAAAAPAPAAAETQVLMVHGYGDAAEGKDCNGSTFESALRHFREAGRSRASLSTVGYYVGDSHCDVTIGDGQAGNDRPIQTVARDLARYVYTAHTQKGEPVDIVAHSMGGLVTRVALLGSAQGWKGFPPKLDVDNVVTLSTPHRGIADPDAFDTRQWSQMRPGSGFLDRLHEDGLPAGTDWTFVGSQEDATVSYDSGIDKGVRADQKLGYQSNLHDGGDVTHTGVRTLGGGSHYDLNYWHAAGGHGTHHTLRGWSPLKAAFQAVTRVGDGLPRVVRAAAPELRWRACADGFECARAVVPRDYARPAAGTFSLAVTRLPARERSRRIGSLFVNFGGPGSPDVRTLQANGRTLFAALNRRFDIVSFDPRGVGDSVPAVDCDVDQEREGPFAQPFTTPSTLDRGALVAADRRYVERCARRNRGVLPYVATANVARDLDGLRRALGDRRLSYLGLSYGTYLGATYASLFPRSYRALVLEGALDPDRYANRPMSIRSGLAAAQERAASRFLEACGRDQPACAGFGGDDPRAALDALIARLDTSPLTVGERELDGDDVRVALGGGLHAKSRWGLLARGLVAAERGDGAVLRELADGFYGRMPDGTQRPFLDQFFAVTAADQRNRHALQPYLRAGEDAWNAFDHAYHLAGYGEHAWGADRVRAVGTFRGPFRAAASAPAVLVVGTTFDPATPYKDAQSLTRQLGNARLLTMDGDGHGSYGGESPCIDARVEAYLEDGSLPPPGTRCRQVAGS